MPPLVSIIIPCYNAARWLAETLESALSQSWLNVEIIVVDDGSTDESAAIARQFASRGIRLIEQANRGASAARNLGLQHSQGRWIQFLDADDLLGPTKIASQVERLQQAGDHCIASARWGRFINDRARASFVDVDVFRDFQPIDFLLLHTGRGRMMHPAAWLVPRVIVDLAGPWDERLSLNDDGEYFARVALVSRGIVHVPEAVSYYRSNVRGSLSGRRSRTAMLSLMRAAVQTEMVLLQHEDSVRVHGALADFWKRNAYEFYPSAPDLSQAAEARSMAHGGSTLLPPLGKRQQLVARLIGWKATRRLARLFGR